MVLLNIILLIAFIAPWFLFDKIWISLCIVIVEFIIFMIFLVKIAKIVEKEEKEKKALYKELLSNGYFSFSNGCLYLNKKHQKMHLLFKSEPLYSTKYTYTPAKYSYVGVSGGGVSLGEVQKTGDYYTGKTAKTDSFRLYFYIYDDVSLKWKYAEVYKIKLKSEELITSAKSDEYIKLCLSYECDNIIEVVKDVISNDTKRSIKYGSRIDVVNSYNDDKINNHPSEYECKKIINWISSEE